MPSNPSPRRAPRAPDRRETARSAYSLVEVVMAISLMSATLVASVELIRDGMEQSEQTDRRQLLALYAVSQLEERLGVTAMSWSPGTFSGDYATDGHADLRYTTACSDDPLDGGVEDLLMDIRTTVYHDANGDDALSAGEMSCSYRTKIGKFATYESLAP